MIKGFTFGFDATRGNYRAPRAVESLKKLRETGSEWVCIAFYVHQEKYSSTEIFFDYKETPTDKDIVYIISKAHELGFKVCFKPVINCRDSVWRAEIDFPDHDDTGPDKYWDRWFSYFNAFLCHYAEIAAETGCEMFCVGCEMLGTERKEKHWRETIGNIKKIYHGPLMYNTNHGNEDVVQWFDAVDYLGISAYYVLTDKPNATEEEMLKGWLEHKDKLKTLSEKWNKPIIFAEVGCRATAGAATMPWDYLEDFPYSEDEQANLYTSCFKAFSDEPWLAGFFWWHWDTFLYDLESGEKDMGFTVYGKKAEHVLREWYGKPDIKPESTKQKIIRDLWAMGIMPDDTLLVHSSYKSLGSAKGSPELVIEVLMEHLKDGTLLMPALSYENVTEENPCFNNLETPSCVGILPEVFRKMPDVYRSTHPTHSVAAFGKYAKEMTKSHHLDRTPVGENSPFTLLKKYGGKVLMLGCGLEPNTLIHGVEETVGTPYVLSDKPIAFDIISFDGKQEKAEHFTHNFYNKNGEYIHQRYERILKVMPIKGGMILDAVSYLLDANILWDAVATKIKEDDCYFVDGADNQ